MLLSSPALGPRPPPSRQVWGGLPLDDPQLVALAGGIGITADAEVTNG